MATLQQSMAQAGDKVFLSLYGFAEEIEITVYGDSPAAVVASVARGGPEVEYTDQGEKWKYWVDLEVSTADVAAFAPEMTATVDAIVYTFERALHGPDEYGQIGGRFSRLCTDIEKSGPGYRG